ncbi:MAG TPA: NAD(P)-dependent oxidoreductase [Chitinophagaceae bacterium]|nr:hydroxyacid dehydrogenase [Chitinophagaceae bacterium]MCC6633946.1 hydroxyacid dehydrogenase [Chitinophagaceae bacterium]HMZ45395.1 NAD(P)-dependent oxidoreductase [Chitinophagaceae bacterium]HNE92540.1 NAD(P)-dependent oxidoreductase [Chitinophagaceae bacterium]HNJ57463.1 NAD(P)-dependent oxidoreductase [Chitinophagaceae bacterium]
MKRIIISGYAHSVLQEMLSNAGFEVIYNPTISYQELLNEIEPAVGLITTTRIKADEMLLRKATNLKFIGRLGSGMDLIDVEFAKQKNIKCLNSPEGNRNAVAEHTLALLLNLMNKINISYDALKQNIWAREENRGDELEGKIVGIIGFGNTGKRFAELLQPFNVTVLAYDKYKFGFASNYIKQASFEQICKQANVISFHVPLTAETHYYANDSFFNSLQQQPYFLNTCRGKVTNTKALINALENKKIKAAGLDVLENEQLSTYTTDEKIMLQQLIRFNNVIITPHTAGVTAQSLFKMSKIMANKILDL